MGVAALPRPIVNAVPGLPGKPASLIHSPEFTDEYDRGHIGCQWMN